MAYNDAGLRDNIRTILGRSVRKSAGVLVMASVLKAENYAIVLRALDVICEEKERSPDSVGNIALVACKTRSARAKSWGTTVWPSGSCHGCAAMSHA